MDKKKVLIISLSVVIGLILLAVVIVAMVETRKPKSNGPAPGPSTMVSTPVLVQKGPSQIPRKLYSMYEDDDGSKYARSIKFDNTALQGMNVLAMGGIVEPSEDNKNGSYGIAILHSDSNGQSKLAVISNYNTDNASYRHFDVVDNKGQPIRNMRALTNVNTILFGLANGLVYYYNPIQDHFIPTSNRNAKHISGTTVDTNILIDNTVYNVEVKNGTLSLTKPSKVDIPSGYYRVYGPNLNIYADINPATGRALVTLPNGTTTVDNVSDISFTYGDGKVGTIIIYRNDKNFISGKYLLGDSLLIGRNLTRTADMEDATDVTLKLD